MSSLKNSNVPLAFDSPLQKCPICRSEDIHFFKKDYKDVSIWKCHNCGIEFMNPQYTDKYLTDFYNQYQEGETKHYRFDNKEEPRRRAHAFNISEIENYVSKGRFLSVGSGNGLDLQVALERGWKAEGYDVDENFTSQLSEKLKIPVKSGDFMSLDYKPSSFDCVYLNHVLEHPKNPGDYLSKIYSILKPGGILYIACPNIDSFANTMKTVFESLGLKGKKAKHYDTWQHLFYYNPFKLRDAMEQHYGYKVLKVENDIEISKEMKIYTPAITYPYKSAFRLFASK